MFLYEKTLQYPVNIKTKDLRMAKYLTEQYGGPNGELGAALRYFNQRYTMPDERGAALLTDIACEELGHLEIIASMFYQLTKHATIEELERAGLGSHFAAHGLSIFPSDSSGVPFSAGGIGSTGDAIADLEEDMAAEEKARATYENLMNLTNDKDILGPLAFLRQREIVHYARFKELKESYEGKIK